MCNQNTGVCSCKEFVTGTSCDQCLAGFQNLEASNPSGCSAREYCMRWRGEGEGEGEGGCEMERRREGERGRGEMGDSLPLIC